MFKKISLLIFIVNILQGSCQEINDSNEVIARCNYIHNIDRNQYVCNLFEVYLTSPNQTLIIEGQHYVGHTNEHVQAVLQVGTTRLNYFNGEIMRKFINLQSLHFGFLNPVHGFAKDAFDSCRQLRDFEIRNLNMLTLPNELFKNCRNLRNFDVISLNISSLPNDLFGTIQSLENFHLSRGRLTTLPSSIFEYSFNLRSINLAENQISTLDQNLLRNSRIIESIDLSSNAISNLNVIYNLLNGVTSLRRIELFRTGVATIDFNFFNQFQWLNFLVISTNQLLTNIAWTRLPPSLTTLRVFHIGENIPQNAFSHLVNLKSLLLEGANIQNFHSNTFQNLINLQELVLQNCGLTSLHPQLFSTLVNLQTINLSFNMIDNLPVGVFGNLSNLGSNGWGSISMIANRIRRINRNSFGVHPYLEYISFSGNKIYEIERGIFSQNFPNLRFISMYDNECANGLFHGNFDEHPELEYCFTNWLGITTTTPAMTTSTMTTTTTDGAKGLKIDMITISVAAFFCILIRNF